MYNLSEVEFFIGVWTFSTNRFRPDGLKEKGERKKEGERFFAPTGNRMDGRVSTDRFNPYR